MICPRCFKEIGMAQSCPSCGFSFEKEEKRREKANALPLFYRLANRYEIGELLGAGGFGITYLAREIESGEILAVKEFFPSHICARGVDGEVVAQKNRAMKPASATFLKRRGHFSGSRTARPGYASRRFSAATTPHT